MEHGTGPGQAVELLLGLGLGAVVGDGGVEGGELNAEGAVDVELGQVLVVVGKALEQGKAVVGSVGTGADAGSQAVDQHAHLDPDGGNHGAVFADVVLALVDGLAAQLVDGVERGVHAVHVEVLGAGLDLRSNLLGLCLGKRCPKARHAHAGGCGRGGTDESPARDVLH